jgi:hypothetical protein
MFSRQYRSSKLGPFTANVAFLILDCTEVPMERIMTFVQESPVQLPNCGDRLDCDWEIFKDRYRVCCKSRAQKYG